MSYILPLSSSSFCAFSLVIICESIIFPSFSSVSNRYDRVSAYFNSQILLKFCKGLHSFFKNNNGKIRFIFSNQITQSEMNDIENAYKMKMDEMSSNLKNNDFLLSSDFELANLSYLIVHGLAEVKIAFMVQSTSALCHIKAGLFCDEYGNKVYFEGSGNETINGIENNAEIFHTFNNFNGYSKDVVEGEERINKLWNNEYSSSIRCLCPQGDLYEELKKFNRNQIFLSQEELIKFEKAIFVDLDERNSLISLADYTYEQLLASPMVLSSYISDKLWQQISNSKYQIKGLSIHLLRDIVIENLNRFGVKFYLSPKAQEFLKRYDNKINKRIKLGLSIKQGLNRDIWSNEYFKFKKIVDSQMEAKLKDKQMLNAFFHFAMNSSADYSVPGTGKTYISYGLFSYLSAPSINLANKIVIFGPLNCFKAWKDEGKAIFNNHRNLYVFDISEHKNDYEQYLKTRKYDVYIFNYDFFVNNIDKKIKILGNFVLDSNTLLVLDEIHKLKSPNGKKANNILNLLEKIPFKPIYKLALTGTPLPNSFIDVMNYIRILYPDDKDTNFKHISKNFLSLADSDPQKSNIVIDELLPTFVRTTKKELNVPIPDKDDLETLAVAPSFDEEKLFESIWKLDINPLVKFIRLIQASSNPLLLKKAIPLIDLQNICVNNDDSDSDYSFKSLNELTKKDFFLPSEIGQIASDIEISSKMKATLSIIVNLVQNNKRVLVWCLFVDTINFIKEFLNSKGIKCCTIYGADSQYERDEKIEGFKSGIYDVIITNPNTLAESVSLHMVCHEAIYVEYGFNLTYMLQSKDRINRVGLPDGTKTHYYFAVCKSIPGKLGSIDLNILEKLEKKAQRMLSVIESNELKPIGDNQSDIDDILEIIGQKTS